MSCRRQYGSCPWVAASRVDTVLAAVMVMSATPSFATHDQFVSVALYTSSGSNVPFVNISVPGSGYNGIAVFDTGSPLFWMPEGTVFHGECPNPFVPTVATGAVPLNRNTSFAYGSGYMYGPVFNVRTPACTDSHCHTDLLLRGGVSGTALTV
jgi:hypothetical protein